MPKFCPQCGSQISDDSAFCANCGTRIAEPASINNTPYETQPLSADSYSVDQWVSFESNAGNGYEIPKNNSKRNKIIGISAVGIVLIAVIAIVFSLIFGGYKGAVRRYMNTSKEYIYCRLPKVVSKNIKVKYDILKSEKYNKDELDELEEHLEDQYKDVVDEKIKVSKAYEVKVNVKTTVKTDDDKDKSQKIYLTVAKVNGDWTVVKDSTVSQINDDDDDDDDYDYDYDYDDYDYDY